MNVGDGPDEKPTKPVQNDESPGNSSAGRLFYHHQQRIVMFSAVSVYPRGGVLYDNSDDLFDVSLSSQHLIILHLCLSETSIFMFPRI